MKALLTGWAPVLVVALTLGVAVAKLPPAPPMDPAAAEAKKEKDAAAAAAANAQMEKAQDKAVASFTANQKAKGTGAAPQMAANPREAQAVPAKPTAAKK